MHTNWHINVSFVIHVNFDHAWVEYYPVILKEGRETGLAHQTKGRSAAYIALRTGIRVGRSWELTVPARQAYLAFPSMNTLHHSATPHASFQP